MTNDILRQANLTDIVLCARQAFLFVKFFVSSLGALAILMGACLAGYHYVFYRFGSKRFSSSQIRLDLAQSIVLGLEFFVASDVIETTIAPDFTTLGILGALVIIRTALNFSIEREISSLSSATTAS